jgi:uncharacterized protein
VHEKTSISRISFRRHPVRYIRPVAIILSVFALAIAVIMGISFIFAGRIMRADPEPLGSFNRNVMPDFSVISFPSMDEQSQLQGWFIPTAQPAVSTIIMVHDQGKNRLQFGQDTALLYQHLVDRGFNVLSFDLRHSGQSDGDLSGFGYAEWSDVVAAIRFTERHAATKDVLLYGFGTGVSASLIAWDRLAEPDKAAGGSARDHKIYFDQSYISGLLLDTPTLSPDDAIASVYRDQGWFGRRVLSVTVPYAVRLSSGSMARVNHSTLLGAFHRPVFIAWQTDDTLIHPDGPGVIVDDRTRLHPDLTMVYRSDEPGHITGFTENPDAYLAALDQFLSRYFP